jgi:mandelamide amidase
VVASGILPFALGTDTTGGIRIPAACCGIVGFRPTINRWPSDFGMKLTFSFDSVGPLCNSVRDASFLDEIVSGQKQADTKSLKAKDFRIGIPNSHFYDNLDPHIKSAASDTIEKLRTAGFTLVENDSPENVRFLTYDLARPIISYEAHRAI